MMTDEQKKELGQPLNRAKVKTRSQAGMNLSYVDGFHVMEEANRIFGHDGWTYNTIRCEVVQDEDVNGKKRVSYTAHVQVTVGSLVRSDMGFGQGINQDVGQAHESAIKEAVTDGMKRALRGFGYTFGLALYDKTQEHVEAAPKVDHKAMLKSIGITGNDDDVFKKLKKRKDWTQVLEAYFKMIEDFGGTPEKSNLDGFIDSYE